MNAIITVEDLYSHSRDKPIDIPILCDVVYHLKRSAGISAKALAKVLKVRRSALSNAVQLLTGETLNELLKQWKLLHAQYLLRHTPLCYESVAKLCGYRTVDGLSKFLERNIGCTAREYREKRVHGNRQCR